MATPKKREAKSDTDDGDSEFIIDAMPTKELFIDMLTRDIALIPAIIDLVDNCADGAKKIKGEGSLLGLWARLEISPQEFRIADNCGGISVQTARDYAFRFGRASGAPSVKHSVGQFGVGMKRAIFKMGENFRVESTTSTTRFVVEVDVKKWAKLPKWKFEFAELDEAGSYSDEKGTIISVTSLHQDVADEFGLSTFETELGNELKAKLQDPIARGLAVTLNGIPLNAEPLTMLSDDQLAPVFKQLVYKKLGKPVTVKLYCGLGRSSSRNEERAEAGWHVFCNGRLILEGDKSAVTGWGEEVEDVISIPGFHGQYNHLRGFAYFDSDDPGRLPWNTTKTGLNTDSPVYRAVKLEMMTLMRPVVDFLNRLKEEKQGKDDPDEMGPLESILEDATPTPIATIVTRSSFIAPSAKPKRKPSGPTMQKIQYDAPLDEVLSVKKALKATSWKEVGEKTFRYFYNAEVEE